MKFDEIIFLFCIGLIIYILFFKNKIEAYDDPLIDKLRLIAIEIDPRSEHLVFRAANESFTEDKKFVYLCIRHKNGEYYKNQNMLIYVLTHELSHAFSESVDPDHKTTEFHDNFRTLLKRAEELGYYDPSQPLDYNYCPH